jgi:putative lipoic acid-binding regulatory protein
MHEAPIRDAVALILSSRAHTLFPSKKSSAGKYISFCVSLPVESEHDRHHIFKQFKEHPDITMVL